MGEHQAAKAAIEAALRLETRVVLAEGSLTPLDLARARKAGRLEMAAPKGGEALLEVGGVAIAAGRVVKKGGGWRFKVERLFGEGRAEP